MSKTIAQAILVKGYVSTINSDCWYVYETVNYTGHMPGQTVTKEDLDELISKGVKVVCRRK